MGKRVQPPESPGWPNNPNYTIDFDRIPAKVEAVVNGKAIAASEKLHCMYELGHAPAYYFPIEDLKTEFLEKSDHETFCPYKGVASYWHVKVGDKTLENAIWTYDNPYPEQAHIKGFAGFYWGKMDAWREDGETVPGPREIPGRIDTSNQLKAAFPQLNKEWDKEKNGASPYEFAAESNQLVWWKDASGKEWQERIKDRVLKLTTLRGDGDATPYG